jgi:uncharacterized protein YndB with AHSA1/START domain
MKKPDYVYVSYIATTPEKLWQALMDTELMAQWWVDILSHQPPTRTRPFALWRNEATAAQISQQVFDPVALLCIA